MSEATGEWFVSRGGQRFGPVSFEDLVKSAQAGRLEPRTDMVFGGSMADWQPAGEVEGIFPKLDPAAAAGEASDKPYAPPENSMADSGSFDFGAHANLKFPGVGRLGYFLGIWLLPLVVTAAALFITKLATPVVGPEIGQWIPMLALVGPVLALMVTVNRFHNIQMSGWWTLGMMVPLLNCWLGYRLFACPPGYALLKKMDGVGIFLAILYWGAMLLYIGVVIAMFLGAFGALLDPEALDQWLKEVEAQMPGAAAGAAGEGS